jgi:hypothetical protein
MKFKHHVIQIIPSLAQNGMMSQPYHQGKTHQKLIGCRAIDKKNLSKFSHFYQLIIHNQLK